MCIKQTRGDSTSSRGREYRRSELYVENKKTKKKKERKKKEEREARQIQRGTILAIRATFALAIPLPNLFTAHASVRIADNKRAELKGNKRKYTRTTGMGIKQSSGSTGL